MTREDKKVVAIVATFLGSCFIAGFSLGLLHKMHKINKQAQNEAILANLKRAAQIMNDPDKSIPEEIREKVNTILNRLRANGAIDF